MNHVITRKHAEQVVEAIKAAFPANVTTFARGEDGRFDYDTLVPETNPEMLPKILEDFDGQPFVIVWESGSPYQWTYNFPFGGTDEEFGGTIKGVSRMIPKGFFVEAMTSYSVSLFEA